MAKKETMSKKYIPLYRKYRPQALQEVVGQEHIKKALANAIELKKISHAYLFTGPRGTGKTSCARILAKSLNCKEGPTLTPCGKCSSCVDITNSTPIDVIEIDAASNRKVEDTQNILEKIQYVPVNGKYKIYIIDEVHMLTSHAFNALLKTLEEPPENVIFILATTEPQKVLETITSRCQRFDFRRITTDDIVAHLKNIAKEEKIKIDDDALFTIAKNAAGGMRDSLALLDQVSVLDASKTVTADDVNSLLGRLSFDVLFSLSNLIIESKIQDAIEKLEKIYNSGNEPTQILINLLGYFKNLLIVKNCQDKALLADLTQLNDTQLKSLKSQIENIDTHQIVFLIEKISQYIKELKTTNNQHLWLEVAIIDLANLAQNTSLLALQERVSRLEQGAPIQATSAPYITKPAPIAKTYESEVKKETVRPQIEKNSEIKEEKSAAPAQESPTPVVQTKEQNEVAAVETQDKEKSEDFSPMPKSHAAVQGSGNLSEMWGQLLSQISSTPTRALLTQHSKPLEISADKIVIVCEKEFSLKTLSSESKKASILEAAKNLFQNEDINLIIRLLQPGDELVTVEKPVEKKNPIIKQETQKAEAQAEEEEDSQTVAESKKTKTKIEERFLSDQANMVMQLFDGKYID